jgi:hypothetical protein
MGTKSKSDLQWGSGVTAEEIPLGQAIRGLRTDRVAPAINETHESIARRIKAEGFVRFAQVGQLENRVNARIENFSTRFTEPTIKFFNIPSYNPVNVYNGNDDTDIRDVGKMEVPFYWDGRANAWLSFETITTGLARRAFWPVGLPMRHEDVVEPAPGSGEGFLVPASAMFMSVWASSNAAIGQPVDCGVLVEDGAGTALFGFKWLDGPRLSFRYTGIYYPLDQGEVICLTYTQLDPAAVPPSHPKLYFAIKYRVDPDVGGRP